MNNFSNSVANVAGAVNIEYRQADNVTVSLDSTIMLNNTAVIKGKNLYFFFFLISLLIFRRRFSHLSDIKI